MTVFLHRIFSPILNFPPSQLNLSSVSHVSARRYLVSFSIDRRFLKANKNVELTWKLFGQLRGNWRRTIVAAHAFRFCWRFTARSSATGWPTRLRRPSAGRTCSRCSPWCNIESSQWPNTDTPLNNAKKCMTSSSVTIFSLPNCENGADKGLQHRPYAALPHLMFIR